VRRGLDLWRLEPAGTRPTELKVVSSRVGSVLAHLRPVRSWSSPPRLAVWRVNDGEGERLYIGLSAAANAETVIGQLAASLGCLAEPVATFDVPETPWLGLVTWKAWGNVRPTGSELGQVADDLAHAQTSFGQPSFVALGVRVTRPDQTARLHRWAVAAAQERGEGTDGLPTGANPSLALTTIAIGAPSRAAAGMLATAATAALPGFDGVVRVRRRSTARIGGAASGLAVVGGAASVVEHHPLAILPAAIVIGAGAITASGRFDPVGRRMMRRIVRGGLRPKMARERSGRPPLDRRTLVLAPYQLASLLLPTSLQAVGSTERPSPPEVRQPIGPAIARDPSGAVVHVDQRLRHAGIFVAGDPGTGKTRLLLQLLAADLARWQRERDGALIWLETKGEGARRAVEIGRRVGIEVPVIEVVDTDGTSPWRLDLLDPSDPAGTTDRLARAMKYAFEAGDIRASSIAILQAAFRLALVGEAPNIITAVTQLLSRQAGDLLSEVYARGEKGDQAAAGAIEAWAEYERLPKREFEAAMMAPRSKVAQLRLANGLWSPEKRGVALGKILRTRSVVVLSFASDARSRDLSVMVCSLVAYLLREAIETECDGWQEQGLRVCVFSDEVADIIGAGSDERADVVRLLYDQGRSRGVQLALGTQRLDQIEPHTRRAIESFTTQAYLRLQGLGAADTAAANLRGGFSAADVSAFRDFEGAMKTRTSDADLPAFSVVVPEETDVLCLREAQ